jgi:hypothetical protein
MLNSKELHLRDAMDEDTMPKDVIAEYEPVHPMVELRTTPDFFANNISRTAQDQISKTWCPKGTNHPR